MLILRRQFGRFDYRIEGVCVGWLRGGGDNLPNLIEVGEVQISIGWGVREKP